MMLTVTDWLLCDVTINGLRLWSLHTVGRNCCWALIGPCVFCGRGYLMFLCDTELISLCTLKYGCDKLHLAVAMTMMSQHKVLLPCCCMMQYVDIPVYIFLLACFLPVYWGDDAFRAAPSLHCLCTTECRSVVVYTRLLLLAVFRTINKPGMQHRGVYSFRWEAAAPTGGSEDPIGSHTRWHTRVS